MVYFILRIEKILICDIIKLFMVLKVMFVLEYNDGNWFIDLVFLDIYLNELNLNF